MWELAYWLPSVQLTRSEEVASAWRLERGLKLIPVLARCQQQVFPWPLAR